MRSFKLDRHRGPAVVLAVFLFAAASSTASVPGAQSIRPASPLRLDGRIEDWAGVPRVTDPKTATEFAFQNDARNLYILVVVKEPAPRRAVVVTGMTVLGAPSGKRKQAKGVLFLRREIGADGYIAWRESQGAILSEEDKAEIRKTPRHSISVAFAKDAGGSSYGPLRKQTDVWPPDSEFAAQEKGALYEFRIPLASPDLAAGGIGGTPGASIRLWFEWGGTRADSLTTESGRKVPTNGTGSGYVSGTGRTWGQEYLDNYDPMSRPTVGDTKKFAFAVDVKLAGAA